MFVIKITSHACGRMRRRQQRRSVRPSVAWSVLNKR